MRRPNERSWCAQCHRIPRGRGWLGEATAFTRAVIPHHSMAITRSEHAQLEDVRVCELAAEISEAQRREIDGMDWLIDDIAQNGVAATPEEAEARPVPAFDEAADRPCAGDLQEMPREQQPDS